jgi:hypothetical protein
VAGAAPAERVEHWLTTAGFVDVRVTPTQDVRDNTALSTAIACTWRTAWFVDSMLERTYCDKLACYWLRCLSFKRWVREAAENVGTGKLPS